MLNVEKCICHYNSIGRSKMVEKIGGGVLKRALFGFKVRSF